MNNSVGTANTNRRIVKVSIQGRLFNDVIIAAFW
jgi:hypothetical protein